MIIGTEFYTFWQCLYTRAKIKPLLQVGRKYDKLLLAVIGLYVTYLVKICFAILKYAQRIEALWSSFAMSNIANSDGRKPDFAPRQRCAQIKKQMLNVGFTTYARLLFYIFVNQN